MADDITAAQAGTIMIGDMSVNRLGLGTNRIKDTPDGYALLQRAVELEINFIDTAHVYADGQSETAIGKALSPFKPGLVIATKGGIGGQSDGFKPRNDPKTLRAHLEESLRKLQTDCIDLYQLHRVDSSLPLIDTMTTLKQFQDEGLIRHIGLSEVSIAQVKEAMTVAPIVSVQNEYNVLTRKHEDLVDFCTANKIVFIPWYPLGGLEGDTVKVEQLVAELAERYEATTQQIAIAWLLKRSPMILPIPGTTSVEHLVDNLKAISIELSDADYQQLTAA